MAAPRAHDVDALYAHDQALSDPQRAASEKRASMQSLLSAVRSESAPGNYTCLAFQLLANHAGAHPDQMVGVTPRLVKVCESEAANRMVRVQAARSLATIFKALKGDRQVKLRTGITKVVEGTTDALLVRELLPCLDGLAVTPGSKVGVAAVDNGPKAAATVKVTATATAAVTAAPPAKAVPTPAAPSPAPSKTAKAVSPVVKPAPAPSDKPKVASASEAQTQMQKLAALPAGTRVTPPPAVTTAEELPAYLKTFPAGVVEKLKQSLRGSMGNRQGFYFDQLASVAGCEEVLIVTLAKVAKPDLTGRRLSKPDLRDMYDAVLRAIGEGSAEGQVQAGGGKGQMQVQASEATKPAEAPKVADIAPSENGRGVSDAPVVTDRPAPVAKQEPGTLQLQEGREEGRQAVALTIDLPSPYLVIRELPSHVSAPMVLTLLERTGVQTLDLAHLSVAKVDDRGVAMVHFRDVTRAALAKERLDGRPFNEYKRAKCKRPLRVAFTVGPPTRIVTLTHLYGLGAEALRQLIDSRAKGLEQLDIQRCRAGDGMECAEATFPTPTLAAYLVRSLTTQPHHVMGPRGRPIVATFNNPLPTFPPPSAMDHTANGQEEVARVRPRSASPVPRPVKEVKEQNERRKEASPVKEVKGQSERRREASPPRRSRSRDRGDRDRDSTTATRKRELDRNGGSQSDRRDTDRGRRDGRGRSPARPLPSPSPAKPRRRRRGEDTDDEQDEENAQGAREEETEERMDEEERRKEEQEDRASVGNGSGWSVTSPLKDDASPRRPDNPASEPQDAQEASGSDDRSRSPSPARSEGGFRSLGGESSDEEDARSLGARDEEEDNKSDGGFRSLGGDSSSDEEDTHTNGQRDKSAMDIDTQKPVARDGQRDTAPPSRPRRAPSPLPGGRRSRDRDPPRPERRPSSARRPPGRSRSRERPTSNRRLSPHGQPGPTTTDKDRASRRSPPRLRAPLSEANRPMGTSRDTRPKSPLRLAPSSIGRGEWPPRRLQPSMSGRSPPLDRDRKPTGHDLPSTVPTSMRRGQDDKRVEDRGPRRSPPRSLPSSAPANGRGGKGMSPVRPADTRDMGSKWDSIRGKGGPSPTPLSDRVFRPTGARDPGPPPGRSKRSRSPPPPMMENLRDGPSAKRRQGFSDADPRHAGGAGHYGPAAMPQKPGPPLIGSRGTGTLDTMQAPLVRGRADFQGVYGPSDGPRNMHQLGPGVGGDFVTHYGPASHMSSSTRGGHGRGRSPPRSRRPRT